MIDYTQKIIDYLKSKISNVSITLSSDLSNIDAMNVLFVSEVNEIAINDNIATFRLFVILDSKDTRQNFLNLVENLKNVLHKKKVDDIVLYVERITIRTSNDINSATFNIYFHALF